MDVHGINFLRENGTFYDVNIICDELITANQNPTKCWTSNSLEMMHEFPPFYVERLENKS